MTQRIVAPYNPKPTDKELLAIFPEAKGVIPDKITEWTERKWQVEEMIRKKLTIIKSGTKSEFSRWFFKHWVTINEGEELLKINQQIARLQRLLMASAGKKIKGQITQDQIQQALAVPLENIMSQSFRKFGKTLIGLCPLHKEKTPSFRIYLENNTCWCFGCQQGGNSINFVRLLYGYSFREAIEYLAHHL